MASAGPGRQTRWTSAGSFTGVARPPSTPSTAAALGRPRASGVAALQCR
jgi:hypothetical protein